MDRLMVKGNLVTRIDMDREPPEKGDPSILDLPSSIVSFEDDGSVIVRIDMDHDPSEDVHDAQYLYDSLISLGYEDRGCVPHGVSALNAL